MATVQPQCCGPKMQGPCLIHLPTSIDYTIIPSKIAARHLTSVDRFWKLVRNEDQKTITISESVDHTIYPPLLKTLTTAQMNFITPHDVVTLFPSLTFHELAVHTICQPSLELAFYHLVKGIYFHCDPDAWRALMKFTSQPLNWRKLIMGGLAWDWDEATAETNKCAQCTQRWAMIAVHRARRT